MGLLQVAIFAGWVSSGRTVTTSLVGLRLCRGGLELVRPAGSIDRHPLSEFEVINHIANIP